MKHQLRGRGLGIFHLTALLVALSLASCVDEPMEPKGSEAASSRRGVVRNFNQLNLGGALPTLDEKFSAVAAEVPGFGGLYQDSAPGTFNVYLVDHARIPQARVAVGRFLADAGIQYTALNFINGRFDFRDLAKWRRQIDRETLGVRTMSDIDETTNNIIIGIKNEAARANILSMLDNFGVPSAAADVRVIPEAIAEEELTDRVRPLRGGLQVKAINAPAGTGECTLSYVALQESNNQINYSGPRYVMTNSHCTTTFGKDDDDVIGQPTQADRVGVEFSDPPLHNNSGDSGCPHSNNICRRSDAALFLLDDASDATSNFNAVATKVWFRSSVGTAYYAGKKTSSWGGMPVAKIGRTTGTSTGTITRSCVNVPVEGREMVCQFESNYNSDGGDSGSPVWHSDADGNRWAFGIHWGRAGDARYFSFWMEAASEIGNDILAKTGVLWTPAISDGPNN